MWDTPQQHGAASDGLVLPAGGTAWQGEACSGADSAWACSREVLRCIFACGYKQSRKSAGDVLTEIFSRVFRHLRVSGFSGCGALGLFDDDSLMCGTHPSSMSPPVMSSCCQLGERLGKVRHTVGNGEMRDRVHGVEFMVWNRLTGYGMIWEGSKCLGRVAARSRRGFYSMAP